MELGLYWVIILIFIPEAFGIVCYSCPKETDLSQCSTLTECPNTEICHGNRSMDARGGYVYTLGCIPKSICAGSVFGRRSANLINCCDTNYCNKNVFNNNVFQTSVNSSCPPGFRAHQNNCYVLLWTPSSWAESMRLCDALKAKLAWIEDKNENDFLTRMLEHENATRQLTEEVWLAGTDMALEGLWVWADSMEFIGYTNWAPDEPNNSNDQDCMGMRLIVGFLWDDLQCEMKNYPLCKISNKDGAEIIG